MNYLNKQNRQQEELFNSADCLFKRGDKFWAEHLFDKKISKLNAKLGKIAPRRSVGSAIRLLHDWTEGKEITTNIEDMLADVITG